MRQVLADADRLDPRRRGAETGIAGLRIFRTHRPTAIELDVFGPVCCLVLQGEMHARRAGATQVVAPMHSLFVPPELPLISRIEQSSLSKPFVPLALRRDLALLAELAADLNADPWASDSGGGLRPVAAEPQMVDAMARRVALIGQPEGARKVPGPLIRRELHSWLSASPHCAMLRCLLRPGGGAERIAPAVRAIRRADAAPLAVDGLARHAGISASGVHARFRAVTGTTPLQFQKSLCLIKARRLRQTGGYTVSTAAFAVGCDSQAQFSREFSRRFGRAPSKVLRPAERVAA